MALCQQQPVVASVLDQPPPYSPTAAACSSATTSRSSSAEPTVATVSPCRRSRSAKAAQPRHLHPLLACFPSLIQCSAVPRFFVEPYYTTARLSVFTLVTMNPTRGNNSTQWNSTFASTRRSCQTRLWTNLWSDSSRPAPRHTVRNLFSRSPCRAVPAHCLFIQLDAQTGAVSWIGIAFANVDRLHDQIIHALVAENVARIC
jgi:hypothetical protein